MECSHVNNIIKVALLFKMLNILKKSTQYCKDLIFYSSSQKKKQKTKKQKQKQTKKYTNQCLIQTYGLHI